MARRKMNEDSSTVPTKRKSLGQKIINALGPPGRENTDFVKNKNPLGPPTKAVKKKRY